MKTIYSIVVIIFLVTVISGDIIRHNLVEEKLQILFKKWSVDDRESLPFPLPSLEVIKIPPIEGYYKGNGVKLSYSMNNTNLTGLNNFVVEKLNASAESLTASISVKIPKLSLYAENYHISGRAYLIYPLKGSGNMTLDFIDNKLSLAIRFGTNDTSTWMDTMLFNFKVEKVVADLKDSSWPINQVLNSEGASILANNHDDIVSAVSKPVVPLANEYLVKITPVQLVNLLSTISP